MSKLQIDTQAAAANAKDTLAANPGTAMPATAAVAGGTRDDDTYGAMLDETTGGRS